MTWRGDRLGLVQLIFWGVSEGEEKAVVDDVARIRNHPLVPKSIPVYGYIYDVAQGKLVEVEGARSVGVSA